MKILIVEDDISFGKMLETSLCDLLKAETKFTNDSKHLSLIFDEFRPDIMLLDIVMKEVDGLTVLKTFKSNYYTKNIPIIMTTGQSDPSTIKHAINLGADDYLIKPIDINELVKRIERLLPTKDDSAKHPHITKSTMEQKQPKKEMDFQTAFNHASKIISRRLASSELNIPVLPEIALKVQKLLQNPRVNLKEVTQLVEKDLAISTKILKISNSSYYCGVKKIVDLNQAITRIGIKQIKATIQAISGNQLFKASAQKSNQIMHNLWEHSLACAYFNQLIVHKKNIINADHYFLLGLTHDIGKVFLISLINQAMSMSMDSSSIFTDDVITTLLKSMHNQLGEFIMKKWKYDNHFLTASKNHNLPINRIANSKPVLITAFSNLMTRKINLSLEPLTGKEDELEKARELLELTNEEVEEISAEVIKMIDAMKGAF